MTAKAPLRSFRTCGEEPAQLTHERDTLGLVPYHVVGAQATVNAVIALHEDTANAVWKRAYSDFHTVTLHITGAPLFRRGKGSGAEEASLPGSVSVQACDAESLWNSAGKLRWVQFYLPVSFVSSIAEEAVEIDGAGVTLDPVTGITDPKLLRVLYQALLSSNSNVMPTAEEINDWSFEVSLILLRAYSNLKRRFSNLTKERLTKDKFRKAQEFIEDHLDGPLTMAELSREIGMSHFHFIRAFKGQTGISPYQYVISRRVNKACRLLECTDKPLSEIAYDMGFSSQSHMTSTFTRTIGVSPQLYREKVLGPRIPACAPDSAHRAIRYRETHRQAAHVLDD